MDSKLTIIALALLPLCSCVKDSRLHFVEPDHIGFSGLDPVESTTVCSGRYLVGVIKSGRNLSDAMVMMKVDPDTLAAYNAANGTAFKALDPGKYSVSTLEMPFKASDSRITSELSWDPDELITAVTDDNYVIPLTIMCSDPTMLVKSRKLLLVNIRPSSIGFVTTQSEYTESKDRTAVSVQTVTASLSRPNPRDPVTVECCIDESYVNVFQDATSFYYNYPPEGCITLVEDKATIAAGDKLASFKIAIDDSALAPIHGGHVVPVRLKSVSMKGLPMTTDVTYLVIKPNF